MRFNVANWNNSILQNKQKHTNYASEENYACLFENQRKANMSREYETMAEGKEQYFSFFSPIARFVSLSLSVSPILTLLAVFLSFFLSFVQFHLRQSSKNIDQWINTKRCMVKRKSAQMRLPRTVADVSIQAAMAAKLFFQRAQYKMDMFHSHRVQAFCKSSQFSSSNGLNNTRQRHEIQFNFSDLSDTTANWTEQSK